MDIKWTVVVVVVFSIYQTHYVNIVYFNNIYVSKAFKWIASNLRQHETIVKTT